MIREFCDICDKEMDSGGYEFAYLCHINDLVTGKIDKKYLDYNLVSERFIKVRLRELQETA